MSLDVALVAVRPVDVFEWNVTHNLNKMAAEAGLYKALWYPEELNYKYGRDLIAPLSAGLTLLKSDPERFKKFNPENGWGNYEGLVRFVEKYLDACEENPEAEIWVSR